MKSNRCILVVSAFLLFRLACAAAVFQENFSADPATAGWIVYGDGNLFHWNSTNQNMEVAWDSSRPNSYFYHPLGTTLAIDDSFSLEFDLQLKDVTVTGFFELAIGLLNFSSATSTNFSRANAASPNLFELDYFPDGGFGPSIDATLADMTVSSTNTGDYYFAYDTLPLQPGVTYHVVLNHVAGSATISGTVSTNGRLYTSLPQVFAGPITDFRLDTLSISSYTSTDDPFGDSILAHGVVVNFAVTLPPAPIQNLTGAFRNGLWQTQFLSRSNWLYTLERTSDLHAWTEISADTAGLDGQLTLSDSNAPAFNAFYRIRAHRP